jgi:BCD family chlorophyll transporter-like MFS transporter
MIVSRNQVRSLGMRMLPFSDAASDDLPLDQLLRLALFQVSVGMAGVMLLGTLNRVMIVELLVPATLVAIMVALPVLIAPFRALLGFKSDNHRSAIGWKRVPYLWFGTLWQFGGLAVMPACLLVLGGDVAHEIPFAGEVLAALAFIMTGLGMHMTQTAGLALAADRATDETRPRVVALLYVMFLIGMGLSAIVIGWLLRDFSGLLLIKVVQGCAVATLVLNVIALWKQERVRPMTKDEREAPQPSFKDAWRDLTKGGTAGRLLAVVFLGTMAFNMQDVLLEPYGGEILGLSVSTTTLLTATWAVGALLGFALAARVLARGGNTYRMASVGLLAGVAAFSTVIFAAPMNSTILFFTGAGLIGFGGGYFAISTLTAAMTLPSEGLAGRGLALGAWGAAQATAAGLSTLIGGGLRDGVGAVAMSGRWGDALATPATGYSVVYHIEIALLFLTLIVLGRLINQSRRATYSNQKPTGLGLADFPT